ncbi:expressed unknown protein [Seminavis robusta]|uniref:Secreted protein n=1 Tax=Seminavis robusta TaxID=568900 RepID=A0A9N8HKF0_9STRA|nr:expressed unknown protein [Seminavis robusta]|eukprot:Sro726_g193510.1 n/a (106) ;mRNA; r:37802-38119
MMSSTRFFLFLTVLLQAVYTPCNALNFPLLPGTPPVLCSLVDGPWYLCDQAENFDAQAVPSLYASIATFFNFGDATGQDAEVEEAPAGDGGARRQLRKGANDEEK